MIRRLLNFLSLLDSQGRISLTHLAVYVVLVKLALSPTLSINDAAAAFVALLNYGHKRWVQASQESAQPKDE